MNLGDRTRLWIFAGAIGFGLHAGSLSAQAQWGSIRGNNREHVEERRPEPPNVNRGRETHVEVGGVDRGREPHVEANRGREVVVEHDRGHEAVHEHEPVVVREPRHVDVDIDRHHSYYWSNFHPGMFLHVLPPGYRQYLFGGRPYYYYEGVYYEPSASGYAVVAPPPGVLVPELPPGVETESVGGMVYYYAGGVFYVQQPNGYTVVPPPLGVTVSILPPGATAVTINGMVYYMANNVYFMPVMQNGITVYMTVRP